MKNKEFKEISKNSATKILKEAGINNSHKDYASRLYDMQYAIYKQLTK